MTTGDEPQLGGQALDNSPMISGRGTQIIVSARGAYVAGNTEALIKLMTDDQLILFKQITIRHNLSIFRDEIVQLAETENPALHDFLSEMDQWLDEPSPEHLRQLQHRILSLESSSPIEYGLQNLIMAADHSADPFLLQFINKLLVENRSIPTHYHVMVLGYVVTDWEKEVAWAILRGAASPPNPATDLNTIETLLADARLWYEKRDLRLLARLLDEEQRQQLRPAILAQAMRYIDGVFPPDAWNSAERRWIEVAHNWLSSLDTISEEAHGRTREIVRAARHGNQVSDVIYLLIDAFQPETKRSTYHMQCADWAEVIAGYAAAASHRSSDHSSATLVHKERRNARNWQVEAAWAILHGETIPPYEFGAANTSG